MLWLLEGDGDGLVVCKTMQETIKLNIKIEQ